MTVISLALLARFQICSWTHSLGLEPGTGTL
jgi:hypothetical protein